MRFVSSALALLGANLALGAYAASVKLVNPPTEVKLNDRKHPIVVQYEGVNGEVRMRTRMGADVCCLCVFGQDWLVGGVGPGGNMEEPKGGEGQPCSDPSLHSNHTTTQADIHVDLLADNNRWMGGGQLRVTQNAGVARVPIEVRAVSMITLGVFKGRRKDVA